MRKKKRRRKRERKRRKKKKRKRKMKRLRNERAAVAMPCVIARVFNAFLPEGKRGL
jgi:hypothetical protein